MEPRPGTIGPLGFARKFSWPWGHLVPGGATARHHPGPEVKLAFIWGGSGKNLPKSPDRTLFFAPPRGSRRRKNPTPPGCRILSLRRPGLPLLRLYRQAALLLRPSPAPADLPRARPVPVPFPADLPRARRRSSRSRPQVSPKSRGRGGGPQIDGADAGGDKLDTKLGVPAPAR